MRADVVDSVHARFTFCIPCSLWRSPSLCVEVRNAMVMTPIAPEPQNSSAPHNVETN